jgi:putative SOS response-associated peptidase YedK
MMCTAVSTHKNTDNISLDFGISVKKEQLAPVYYKNAFTFPKSYVITQEEPHALNAYTWGLIPTFAKSLDEALKIRVNTINARGETVFEKPSFRQEILQHRCVIPVDGFFEYKEVSRKKYPHYIVLKDNQPMLLGGIYSRWFLNGETYCSFSVLTTEANELMAEIHNTKKRMPLILDRERSKYWLQNELNAAAIGELITPFDSSSMDAYTVPKLTPESLYNPHSISRHDYSELSWTLF